MDPIIDVARLTYSYPESDRPALANLDLRIPRGELLLLAGRSGSGKSTLLRALNGLVPHFYGGRFGGSVLVAGLDTRRTSPVEMAGQVGFVFQEPEGGFITGNVADEIAFGMEVAGLPGRVIRERVEEIIERLELDALLDRPLDRLSGGEQQRVAVAAALARKPSVLLLDEPTSQLDAQSAEAVLEWVAALRADLGLTAVIAEHRLARIAPRVDRALYLGGAGERPQLGGPEEVLAAMPYGPPLIEASRLIGERLTAGCTGLPCLRQSLLGLPESVFEPCRRPEGGPRLAAQGMAYAYNGLRALEDILLEVWPGEIVALLGRNGSGKTTLLRCIMGLLTPQAGAISYEGERIDAWPVARRARHLAYVPQWPSALLFADSVRAEMDLTLANHGLTERPPCDPEQLLEELGLAGVAHRYPRDLSAGERQRAAIAAVAVTRPGVVLLDEPTLGIDPLAQRRLGRLLQDWRASGTSIVLATHDVEFAAANADRVLILERGSVRAAGPTAETIFSQPGLRTALQQLTGRARPASPEDLARARSRGDLHADDRAGANLV